MEAYKAAYLYTYLANIQYVTDLVLFHNVIPISYKKKKDDNFKNQAWTEEIRRLKDEDSWESTTYQLLNSNEENGNIFELKPQIRDVFSEMRRLRNTSAHAKERQITESTVQELWNNIRYIKPYLVINGTTETWLSRMNRSVLYSKNSDIYGDDLKVFAKEFSFLSVDMKKELLENLIKRYVKAIKTYGEVPNIVFDF